jgi:hypothetical protein
MKKGLRVIGDDLMGMVPLLSALRAGLPLCRESGSYGIAWPHGVFFCFSVGVFMRLIVM